jgi:chemotaxis protein CheZ
VPQKQFRVERMRGTKRAFAATATQERPAATVQPLHTEPTDTQELKRELALIHDIIGRNRRELMALKGSGSERHMVRAAGELGAAVDGMENATQKILKSTEAIDENARALGATLKTDYACGLAQEIQEQALLIYEACNFQDIAGQRIGKVMATLNAIDEHVVHLIALWERHGRAPQPVSGAGNSHSGRALVNGPKLDGDTGHASQCDIDAMFG